MKVRNWEPYKCWNGWIKERRYSIKISTGEIPEKYILKNEVILPAIDASPTLWNQSLFIDFSPLSVYDPSTAAQNELTKLHSA